jgi:hypothetical protein
MALRPALSNGLPFSSVQSEMMFKTWNTLSSNPWHEGRGGCKWLMFVKARGVPHRMLSNRHWKLLKMLWNFQRKWG